MIAPIWRTPDPSPRLPSTWSCWSRGIVPAWKGLSAAALQQPRAKLGSGSAPAHGGGSGITPGAGETPALVPLKHGMNSHLAAGRLSFALSRPNWQVWD